MRNERLESANEGVCFTSHQNLRRTSQVTRSPGDGKAGFKKWNERRTNYREACRARSNAEFRSKMGIVEQELDETQLWLELLVESGVVAESKMSELLIETDELLRITVSSITTSKKGRIDWKPR